MDKQLLVPWIERSFGGNQPKLVRHALNVLSTPDHAASVVACGHFLAAGLARGERVVLVSFDHPDHILGCMQAYGFEFSEALSDEQLLYVYYKSSSARSVRLTADYHGLFDELLRLCNGSVDCAAFLNVEVLINLQSLLLAQTSVAELALATAGSGATVLGCHTPLPGNLCDYLDAACHAAAPASLRLTRVNPRNKIYALNWIKSPVQQSTDEIRMELHEGQGYVDATPSISATA